MIKPKLKLALILLLGAILGVASSLGDVMPFGSAFYIIGGFLNTASLWCLSAFLIGTVFRSRKNAVIFPISFLTLSVCSYYLTGYFWGNRSEVPLITLIATSLSWIIIAVFVGSLCGLAGMTAKYSKDIKKRIVAVTIPMVIIITECFISIIQLLPYLNSNNSNYIPFGILVSLTCTALVIPFLIYRNKRIAFYNMVLGVLLSITGAVILMALSSV